jgi:hypothetical protein
MATCLSLHLDMSMIDQKVEELDISRSHYFTQMLATRSTTKLPQYSMVEQRVEYLGWSRKISGLPALGLTNEVDVL